MNTQQEYNDRLMKEMLKSSMIENAPAGFTEKIMTRVNLEAKPVKTGETLILRYKVPVISLAVTLILIVTVVLLPASSYEFQGMSWMKIVKNINLPVTKINLDSLFNISIPGYLPYLLICILFLMIFDRGLNVMFHRGK
jgi:hypothetical protein